MSASAGVGLRRGAMDLHALTRLQSRPVRVEALGAPLAGPPIVARRCAPGEGTGSRPWAPTKGATER